MSGAGETAAPAATRPARARRLLDEVVALPEGPEPRLHLSEALVLGAGVVLAVVAWASLVLAHAGAHSLAGVAVLAVVPLGALAVLVWRLPGRPRLHVDGLGLLLLAGLTVGAAVFALPGFPYGVVDKDPGVYVVHAQAIAREGSVTVTDDLVADDLPVTTFTPGARFPGIWQEPGDAETIRPQFFHLYPALLATADDLGGVTAVNNANALLAVLAVLALALAVRRAFGLMAAGAAGTLLATNMLQVWQAKYPTTEILAQVLLVLALLAAAVALETRWRPPALLAGLFLSLTFLARPDGILLVLGGLGAAGAIVAVAGWDRRIGWFLVGLAAALPHAALQAWRWNRAYSDANDVPTPATVLVLAALVLAGTVLYRRLLRGPVERAVARLVERFGVRRLQVAVGSALTAATVLFLVVLWHRETLLGEDLLAYNDTTIRSFDEVNLIRLTWFLGLPALVLLCAGVLLLGVRRWRGVQWLVVLPTVALLPVYLWAARISPRLMWWGRRYVPSALVGIVVLVAIALAVAWAYRGRWWPGLSVAATVAFVGLVAFHSSQSVPLRAHRELAGSAGLVGSIAELSGDEQGIFLWSFAEDGTSPGRDLGAGVWLAHDQLSTLLPRDEDDAADTVAEYRRARPDQPLFVVTPGEAPPPGEVAAEPVLRIEQTLPFWEEPVDHRPRGAGLYGVDLTVWAVDPPGAADP